MAVRRFEEYEGGDGRPLLRFALFAGANYYPSEGVKDLVATADTYPEIMLEPEVARLDDYSWCQVVETSTLKILYEREKAF